MERYAMYLRKSRADLDAEEDSIIAPDVHKLDGSADHKVKMVHELGQSAKMYKKLYKGTQK